MFSKSYNEYISDTVARIRDAWCNQRNRRSDDSHGGFVKWSGGSWQQANFLLYENKWRSQTKGWRKRRNESVIYIYIYSARACVCVWIYVYEKEKERNDYIPENAACRQTAMKPYKWTIDMFHYNLHMPFTSPLVNKCSDLLQNWMHSRGYFVQPWWSLVENRDISHVSYICCNMWDASKVYMFSIVFF